MKEAGTALMGIGIGTGETRAEDAAKAAISSPLLEQDIKGATGILFNVMGGPDMTMKEVDKAANIINKVASPDANIIFGTTIDQKYSGQVKITVIATGFDTTNVTEKLGMTSQFNPARQQEKQERQERVDKFDTKPQSQPTQPAEKTTEDVKKKDTWRQPDDFESDTDSKYDIPAFLRGR